MVDLRLVLVSFCSLESRNARNSWLSRNEILNTWFPKLCSLSSTHVGVLRFQRAYGSKCPSGAIMVSRGVVDVQYFQLIETGEQQGG